MEWNHLVDENGKLYSIVVRRYDTIVDRNAGIGGNAQEAHELEEAKGSDSDEDEQDRSRSPSRRRGRGRFMAHGSAQPQEEDPLEYSDEEGPDADLLICEFCFKVGDKATKERTKGEGWHCNAAGEPTGIRCRCCGLLFCSVVCNAAQHRGRRPRSPPPEVKKYLDRRSDVNASSLLLLQSQLAAKFEAQYELGNIEDDIKMELIELGIEIF